MPETSQGMRRLGWTVGGLAAAVAPHVAHLQAWVTPLAVVVAAWRLLAERRGWALPGRLLRSVVALAAAAGVAVSYRALTGLNAGTALLTLMASLKLLETRAPRDHVVLVFIGWFLCLATFLYGQGLAALAWVVPAVWLLTASLLHVSRRGAEDGLLRPFRTSGGILLKALPIAAVLFVFFPRVTGHFWGAPSQERAVTGLSDEMSPGDLSELSVSDAVAFRVRFHGALPRPVDRYWRGPVLVEFDGFTWSRAQAQAYFRRPVEYLGPAVSYTVTLEPTGQRILFAPEMPGRWPTGMAEQGWDFRLVTRYPVDGLQLDYIRFCEQPSCFCASCRRGFEQSRGKPVKRWPADALDGPAPTQFRAWKEAVIHSWMRTLAAEARRLRPGTIISFAQRPDIGIIALLCRFSLHFNPCSPSPWQLSA